MIYSSCLKYQINDKEPQILKIKDYDWAEAINSNPGVTLESFISITFLSNFYAFLFPPLSGIPVDIESEIPKLGVFINSNVDPEHPEGSITAKGFDRELFLSIILMEFQFSGQPTPLWVTEELPNIPNKDLSEFLELKGFTKGTLIEADEINTLKIFKLTIQELNDLNEEEELLEEFYVDAYDSVYESIDNRLSLLDNDPLYEIATINSAEDVITLKSIICFGKNEDFDLRHYSYSISNSSLIPNNKYVVLYLSTTNKETMETEIETLLPTGSLAVGAGIQAVEIFNQGPTPLVFNPMFTLESSQYLGDIYSKNEFRFLHAQAHNGRIVDPSIGSDDAIDPLVSRYLNNLNRLAEGFVTNPSDKETDEILNYILPLDKTMVKVLIEFLPFSYKVIGENFGIPQLLTTYGEPSNWIYEFQPINVKAIPVPADTADSEFDPDINMDGYDFFQVYSNTGLAAAAEYNSLNIDSNWVVKYVGEPLDLSSLEPPEGDGGGDVLVVDKAKFYVNDINENLFYSIEVDGVLYNNNFTDNILNNFLNLGDGMYVSTNFDSSDESLVVFNLYGEESGRVRNVKLSPVGNTVGSNIITGSPINSYDSQNKTLSFKIITQPAE